METAVATQLLTLNDLILAHNQSHDNFNTVQTTARTKLKHHFLAENQTRYQQLEAEVAAAKAHRVLIDNKHSGLEQKAEQLRQDMRQHSPAASLINRMIHSYLRQQKSWRLSDPRSTGIDFAEAGGL